MMSINFRMKKHTTTKWILGLVTVIGFSSAGWAQQAPASGGDKLDIKKLEEQYWSAKDDDFSVVQNRAYTKAKRFFATASGGVLMNDGFSLGRMQGLTAGYFFTERYGVEITSETGSLRRNDTTKYFQNQFGASPDYNEFKGSMGIAGTFVPFYAKMSWMDKTVLYFDMSVSLGIGKIDYSCQTNTGDLARSSSFYNLDVSQHLFFTNNFALRFDLKNKWSKQEIYKYSIPGNASEDTRRQADQQQNDTSVLLGITYFH